LGVAVSGFAGFSAVADASGLAPVFSPAGCCARTEKQTIADTTTIPIAYFDRFRQTRFIEFLPTEQIFQGIRSRKGGILYSREFTQICRFLVNN
jgi:hypothetical protein